MLILTRLDIPMLSEQERKDSGPAARARSCASPCSSSRRSPAMLSYGIMNLLMTSTPLAMHAHDHHFNDAAFVLQWHMIGMYGPSFFTGSLIQRFGVLNIILAGIVLLFVCIVAALAGTVLINFWAGAVPARRRLEFHVRRRLGAAHRVPHARPSARRRRRRTTS